MTQDAPSWRRRITSPRAHDVGVRCLWVLAVMGVITVGSAVIMHVELFDATATFSQPSYNLAFTIHGAAAVFGLLLWAPVPALGSLLLPSMLGVRDVASPRLNAAATWAWTAMVVLALVLVATDPESAVSLAGVCGFVMVQLAIVATLNLGVTVWRRRSAIRPMPLFAVSISWGCILSVFAGLGGLVLGCREADAWVERLAAAGFASLAALTPALGLAASVGLASDVLEAKLGRLRGRWCIHVAIAALVLGAILPPHGIIELATILVYACVAWIWITHALRAPSRGDPGAVWVLGLAPIFLLATLSRAVLRTLRVDVHLHDTIFVAGSFHAVASCGLVALLAALFAHWPAIAGRQPARRLAQLGAIVTLLGMLIVCVCQLAAGQQGMPRRYQVYHPQFEPYFQLATAGTLILCLGLILTAAALSTHAQRTPAHPHLE
jgi:cytochrome c oxidase subunit I